LIGSTVHALKDAEKLDIGEKLNNRTQKIWMGYLLMFGIVMYLKYV
jgi:hypothetical protein